MIQLADISLAFGGQVVLDRLSWSIRPGRRIGLIGKNGAGKSTLLRMITGRVKPDGGRVIIGGQTSVGYLEQDVQALNSDAAILDEAMEAFADLRELEREEERLLRAVEDHDDHEDAAYAKLLHALDAVHTRLAAQEAHLARPRAEAVLTGLGFDPVDFDRPVKSFSGGWRMRVMLARLLLQRPDYLLLDEPTNHLDVESIDWLEEYLRAYDGTVVIVSHDRYFLDRMVTSIAEVAHGRVEEYDGNYTYYLEERQSRRALQQAAYENQQREIAQIERFVERFRYKATKAKQVQSRVKMLEKLERLSPPPSEEGTVTIRFPAPSRSGRVVLELSRFSKRYESEEGHVRVFEDAGPLSIERGDKIALIGKNGAGKSTLARILNGTEPFDGKRSIGYNVEYSFFAQHQADMLDPSHTIIESLQRSAPEKSDREIRSILGAFLFSGEDVFKRISVLSGGEKSRVALARALLQPANFFILDEPTNHLDAQSIGILIDALRQYEGTLIVVSHDRHFLDQVANRVWYVASGSVRDYPGNYTEFRWRMDRERSGEADATGVIAASGAEGDGRRLLATEKNGGGHLPATAGDAKDGPGSHVPSGSERASAGTGGGPKSREQKRREAEERNRLRRMAMQGRDLDALSLHQLRQAYDREEREVMALEEHVSHMEARLADPSIYQDGDRVRDTREAYESAKKELERRNARWEDFANELAARDDA